MGILIDIILIAIVLLSTFLGYKKGLVKLATKLFAGIIAIIVTIAIYKPVSGIIINNTQIDEKIEQIIIENTERFIEENIKIIHIHYSFKIGISLFILFVLIYLRVRASCRSS